MRGPSLPAARSVRAGFFVGRNRLLRTSALILAFAGLATVVPTDAATARDREASITLAKTNDIVRAGQACDPQRVLQLVGNPIRSPVDRKTILVKGTIETNLIEFTMREAATGQIKKIVIATSFYSGIDPERLNWLTQSLFKEIQINGNEYSGIKTSRCRPFHMLPVERANYAFERLISVEMNILGQFKAGEYNIAAVISELPVDGVGSTETDKKGPIKPTGPCPFKEKKLCKVAGYTDTDTTAAADGSKPTGGSGSGTGADGDGPSGSLTSDSAAGPPTDGKSSSTDGDTLGGGDATARLDGSDGDRTPSTGDTTSPGSTGTTGDDTPDDGSAGSAGGSSGDGDRVVRRPADIIEFPDGAEDGSAGGSGGKIAKRTRYPKPGYTLLPEDRKLPSIGQGVFVVESVECGTDGNWLTGYSGVLMSFDKDNKPVIRLRTRYGVNNYPGVSGDDPVSTSVNKKRWWCIPRKEFCYEKVKFNDWGGKFKKGDRMTAERKMTYGYRHKFLGILQDAVTRACGKSGTPVAEE